jgi:drug/metabolite transporter (DMT)-like permease
LVASYGQLVTDVLAATAVTRRRSRRPRSSDRRLGIALCLISGISFGLAAVVAKEAFRSGLGVTSLLAGRFGIAAVLLWMVVGIRRPPRAARRVVLAAVGLGAVGYAAQSAFYFGALTRLNAGMVAQLLYIYPALVLAIGIALGRDRVHRRTVIALSCSIGGLSLLLQGGGASGPMPALGIAMALGAAATYAVYITVAGLISGEIDVYLLSAIVCTAATVSVTGYGTVTGSLHAPAHASGWFWLVLLAMVPTVVAIATFLAGLRLVGGPVAAILSCTEPVVTVLSAALVFSERLSAVQLVGGAGVLAAVVVLQTGREHRETASTPAGQPGSGLVEEHSG